MEKLKESIPKHLKNYVVEQEYDRYTSIDHSSWRFIMRLSQDFFQENAHSKYLDGLEQTGITTERIPRISEMDEKLQKFGWRAAPITGFIPPAIFSEMLALNIMPIACDMRKLENIHYTPSPDIVHEAAGHAPIVADPDYASFLRRLGKIARRVIFAKEDCAIYEAILELSEIKENPSATSEQIVASEKRLNQAYASVDYVSEATKFARIGWWTIEYGLIKQEGKFLIYGAGLLSSVGESFTCLSPEVPKLPFTMDCLDQDYDITKPQPQLFYCESFKDMENVLEEFENSLAFKQGGLASFDKAIKAETVTTTLLSSGLQVSGQLEKYRLNPKGDEPVYLHYKGPSQLAYQDKQIEGQGPKYHLHGFGTPLGNEKTLSKPFSSFDEDELEQMGFMSDQEIEFEFESGVKVKGICRDLIRDEDTLLIMQFEECEVRFGDEVLFDPSWGTFDMAVGSTHISSVFGGAADRASYLEEIDEEPPVVRSQKVNQYPAMDELIPIYGAIRRLREEGGDLGSELEDLYLKVLATRQPDWLVRLEILEILVAKELLPSVEASIRDELQNFLKAGGPVASLISRGIDLIDKN